MKVTTTLLLILAFFGSIVGCSDEYNPVGPSGSNVDTLYVDPDPEPTDPVYVVRSLCLSVSPDANNDSEIISTGLIEEIACDVWIFVKWKSSAESDMTFRINSQPYALPDPMNGLPDEWVRFTSVKLVDTVHLGLTIDKGSNKKDDDGSDKKSANEVTKIVITNCGFYE